MKKLLTIILAVLISFASLPVYAFAKDVLDIKENRIAEQETAEVTDFAEEPVVYAAASSSGGQWVQESNGRWWYKHADGSYTKYNWEYINGSRYYFNSSGRMVRETLVQGKRTYNFLSSGELDSTTMGIKRIVQGDTKWCWAASAAMIGNYENGTSLTMQDVVTNVKGSLLDEGATTDEEKKALRYALPGKEIKTLQKNQIKFDTFAWYANKNHPEYIEYSQLMNNFPFKATNGEVYHAETIYIHVYP